MQWEADVWVDYAPTLIARIAPYMFKPALGEDGCQAIKQCLTECAEKISLTLKHGKEFLVGARPTIGDFSVYGYLAMWFHNEHHKFYSKLKPIFDECCLNQPHFA